MKEPNEIDLMFQSAFEGVEFALDPDFKANIDRAIAAKKKRRRFLFILFPILLGTTGLAATSYFYSFSGKTIQDKTLIAHKQNKNPDQTFNRSELNQNETPSDQSNRSEQARLITTTITSNSSSKAKMSVVKSNYKVNRSSTIIKLADFQGKKIILSNASASTKTESTPLKRGDIQSPEISEKLENKSLENQKTTDLTETKSDSIPIPSMMISDSTAALLALSTKYVSSSKQACKWSLSIVSGWENEAKRRSERFDSTTFSGNPTEFAQIQTSTFYGKIELNRKLSTRFDAIIGLGFRSSKVKQIGSLYTLDSFVVFEGVGSMPTPDSMGYFIKNQRETITYNVNSIILPLGISFSTPITQKFKFRISGGTEFAYGWKTNHKIASVLSPPKFRPFGWNVWLRPEIHYTFGKFQLFGFGNFNQTLIQQLKWDFKVRRSPSFGAGIGLLINL